MIIKTKRYGDHDDDYATGPYDLFACGEIVDELWPKFKRRTYTDFIFSDEPSEGSFQCKMAPRGEDVFRLIWEDVRLNPDRGWLATYSELREAMAIAPKDAEGWTYITLRRYWIIP